MDYISIIIIILVALVVLFKFYNMFKSITEKGFKDFLIKKAWMLGVLGVIVGIFVVVYPDVELHSPHHYVIDYISKIVEK